MNIFYRPACLMLYLKNKGKYHDAQENKCSNSFVIVDSAPFYKLEGRGNIMALHRDHLYLYSGIRRICQ